MCLYYPETVSLDVNSNICLSFFSSFIKCLKIFSNPFHFIALFLTLYFSLPIIVKDVARVSTRVAESFVT